MANADLLFSEIGPPASFANLVFGANGEVPVRPIALLTLLGNLPQPILHGTLVAGPRVQITVLGAFPEIPLSAAFDMAYMSNTARPTVCEILTAVQVGERVESGVAHRQQDSIRTMTPTVSHFENADLKIYATGVLFRDSSRVDQKTTGRFQSGSHTCTTSSGRFNDGLPSSRMSAESRFMDGLRAQVPAARAIFQEGLQSRRLKISNTIQDSKGLHRGYQSKAGPAVHRTTDALANFQEAKRPPAGVSPVIVPPIPGQYVPDPNLLFWDKLFGTNLVFGRTQTSVGPGGLVVVPSRKVYMVINNASLRRVDGNIQLPVFNMSLSLDVDSWTWSFSAALPGQALPDLEPDYAGAPVEVEAMINGVPYRAVVESIGRSREFGKSDLRVQGRGKTALLDSPYSPIQNFGNAGGRSAQQIMGDVLTVNGVPMDWAVDWHLDDWLVPATVFNHQGSYITALNAIAAAAGGYVQPHASLQSLSVLPRYAVAPWDWAGVTPDFDLPSDVTTREGIEWVERARYNRVFVSGQQSGVLGQVTRLGTAGDLLAPMVTDALITTAGVARQRGLSILANTGRQAEVTLRLPVLAETGVITPGKFVQYTDAGVVRRGVVRSVAVEVGMPEIWQTIGVETHA